MKLALATLSLLLAVAASTAVEHYNDHSVFRVRPSTVLQLSMLQKLQDDEVDFWREPDQVNRFADIRLTPANKERVLQYFNDNGIQYELIIPDVEKVVENERQQLREAEQTFQTRAHFENNNRAEAIAGFWNTYQRYDTHLSLINALVQQNPTIVSRVNIGTSYQGRTLAAARIGSNQNANKPVIWIEGGIHAREWISPATVSYFAQQLVDRYNANNAVVRDLLAYFDFYIVFVLNADGYEYTHTTSRLWRKTRKPSATSPTCIGTDPNRNFGYQWGGEGASANACSETYRGDSPFSEPEVKAETDYILNQLAGKVKSFLSVHSYGQYWLYPWGYTSELTSDNAELDRVAKASVAALNTVSPSIRYTIGTSTNVLYAAAGGADDWSYGSAAKAKYSYTVELRDTGTYGFQLPASQIKASGDETSAAFIALASEVKKAGLREQQQQQ